jgi:hypothetical protein
MSVIPLQALRNAYQLRVGVNAASMRLATLELGRVHLPHQADPESKAGCSLSSYAHSKHHLSTITNKQCFPSSPLNVCPIIRRLDGVMAYLSREPSSLGLASNTPK